MMRDDQAYTNEENIAISFVATALRNRQRIAVIEAASQKSITFGELHDRSGRYSAFFRQEGIRETEIVMLMVKPSIDFICIALSLFKLGATIVLIDPGMGYRNLLRCIRSVEPRYLIGIPKAILFSLVFKSHFRNIQKRFCLGGSAGTLGPDIGASIARYQPDETVYEPSPEDLAAIIFTTGSTGPPKGVQYHHTVFRAQLDLIRDYYNIGADDIDQPAFPLFALFSTALGACAVIPDMDPTRPAHVDPRKFVDSISRYQVTYSFGSPALWNVVGRYCRQHKIVLTSVRKILMAGAPVPYGLLQSVRGILPENSQIHTPYGATESLPIISIEAKEVLTDSWQKTRKGFGTCVGRPLPGIEVCVIPVTEDEVVHFSRGDCCRVEQIGELIVKGRVVTRAYHNNPAATMLSKISDGSEFWHRMGDLGYLDDLGRVWFCGRKSHRVETGTRRLYSVCCEAIFNEHPQVFRSALVGIGPAERQLPVIIVEPRPALKIQRNKLLAELRQLALANPITEEIDNFLIHPHFPVDIRHNAKIFREQLAVWAQRKFRR